MGESPILAELEIAQDGKGVQVEFTKIEGIISHTISLVNDGEKTPVLTSCINELAQPCFTELHQQGETLFLTGANGACHWSMSVQKGDGCCKSKEAIAFQELAYDFEKRLGLNAPPSPTRPVFQFLLFDVACRLKEDIANLGSEYAIVGDHDIWVFKSSHIRLDGSLAKEKNCGLLVNLKRADGILQFGANRSPSEQSFDPDPRCIVSQTPINNLRFHSIDGQPESFPITMRWSYAVWRM